MNNVQCNECGKWFAVDPSYFSIIKKDGLTVQYFSCPTCGSKYHVFTQDAKMRKLIEQRSTVQSQIKIARAKNFRKQTIKKYERELERIIQRQKKMKPQLDAAGEKILRELNEGVSDGT